jgi:hypothetical protein
MEVQRVLVHMNGLIFPSDQTVRTLAHNARNTTDAGAANGSGRKPAHYNGCFSIRPSTGIMNTDGVIGQFPYVHTCIGPVHLPPNLRSQFDMPVFFGRDLRRFSEFISTWYGGSPLLQNPSNVSTQFHFIDIASC